MLTTIKGVYNNGAIILEETPPTNKPVNVLVTFTESLSEDKPKDRQFGIGKGIVTYISPDFDEPVDEQLKDYM
jgi:hypothetical protein